MLAATRIWTSERLVQSRTGTANVLRSTVSLQSKCEQCRYYSPAVSSSTSSEFRNGRRRGSVRFQQPTSLSRSISWDTKSKASAKKAAKGFNRSVDSSKFTTIDQVAAWAGDLFGMRPGANIEDVERSAIEHLFRGDSKANIRKATLTNAHHFSRASASAASSKDSLFSAVHGQDATFIDPITNRRVSKSTTAGTEARYDAQRDYKPTDFVDVSVEADSAPKYNDLDKYKPTIDTETRQPDQPKYDDLDKYEPVIDERSQEKSTEYDDLDKYGPVKYNEPDGKRPTTAEEDSKQYKDLDKYSSANLDDPLAKRQLTTEEKSKVYDDLDQYKPVYHNEPDGKRPQTAEELSKNYDDLHMYNKGVYWNEPDGLREPTPEELSKNYKDLHMYGPVAWNEPDGLRRLTPEEESKQYKDLDQYADPFEASQSVLKAHEKAQMDRTMRGKPLAPKVDAPVEDFASKYDDLHKYGPYHWNEPDGLREPTPEELSKNYDDLHLYGGVFKWNEPDGLRPLTAEEKSKRYTDVHKYAARDLSPPVERVHPEEASKVYNDLPAYRKFENADDPAPRTHPEVASKKYNDLGAYNSFENGDPQTERVHPEVASKQYRDLHKYPSAGFDDIIQAVHPEVLSKNYTDLGSYRHSDFASQAQGYPVQPEEASKVFQDLRKYTGVRPNEPTGKMSVPLDEVARGLREFDSKAGSQDSPDSALYTYSRSPNRSSPGSTETNMDTSSPESADVIRAAVLRRAQESSQRAKNQDLSGNKGQQVKTAHASELTGNYVRDFPEDFARSWSRDNSSSKSVLLPNNISGTSSVKESLSSMEDVEPGSMDESFPVDDTRLKTALDRYAAKRIKDLYSHEPQGLQTSYSEECGRPTMPIMEKHYTPEAKESTTKTSEMPNMASYKIVAFDPVSRVMSVAEANSAVGASDRPMPIPDALVKLVDPAKFLPYFKSLQEEGYEVVSGSGQMLIFRKMQSADEMVSQGGNSPTSDSIYRIWTDSHCKRSKRFSARRWTNSKTKKSTKKRSIGRKILVGTGVVAGSVYAAAFLTKSSSIRNSDVKPQN
ncbi:hypothetical protein NOF04DRAFT_18661 [Fusarium oxysporum II5]|uniref:Uncharacterized protein n=3 Tax=Fusarium oxysporum species complex TaxID=171631 RepID=N1RWX3_FUSC4|nr:uncharacterized protein FOIG_04884 [Fusarium odoratissimum NRRL 54006]XP_031066791.1 uncharacterized protein FOIG_04884 [Fusarium odoratissimum NRRL 54006]EMT69936.1 hypothetical protein FOC4_g10008377 [Fusarium odoratissimum]KAK2126758.1 hypothetical protein NOF04DRAFT_18661 [Fusarium oxysporum II5]TXB99348.1 hypothetical protein FocTR4_00012596 [Fusarium oxysporum f. sp. cubense]EXM04701.1 hypothetical protein FOIG_04884 [Fusarium odoratissimum NRRL 54006]EXM04702.1 hypothetical protein 